MSTDKKPEPHHRPPQGAPLDLPKGISVAHLKFHGLIEIAPAKLANTGVKADMEQTNKARYRITYYPQLRHHQIEFFPAGQTRAEGTYMVHETHVEWWEPAP